MIALYQRKETILMSSTAGVVVSSRVVALSGSSSHADAIAAYTVLRFAVGFAMFMHGLARLIGGLDVYARHYVAGFAGVALPHGLVVGFIYAIPFLEVIVGPPVALGLVTRAALLANAALLLVFIFGSSMQQGWSGVETQLVYTLLVSLLLFGLSLNVISLDHLVARRNRFNHL